MNSSQISNNLNRTSSRTSSRNLNAGLLQNSQKEKTSCFSSRPAQILFGAACLGSSFSLISILATSKFTSPVIYGAIRDASFDILSGVLFTIGMEQITGNQLPAKATLAFYNIGLGLIAASAVNLYINKNFPVSMAMTYCSGFSAGLAIPGVSKMLYNKCTNQVPHTNLPTQSTAQAGNYEEIIDTAPIVNTNSDISIC